MDAMYPYVGLKAEEDYGVVESFKWDSEKTKHLLNAYLELKDKFRDRQIKRKTLWKEVLSKMQEAGVDVEKEDDLDRKMRNVKKTYKRIKQSNRKNPKGRQCVSWEFYDMCEEIFADDETINCSASRSSMQNQDDETMNVFASLCSIQSQYDEFPHCKDDSEASSSAASISPKRTGEKRKRHSSLDYCRKKQLTFEDKQELKQEAIEGKKDGQPFHWDNEKTKYFLNAYKDMQHKFSNPKIKRRTLWREMLKKMQDAGIKVQTSHDLDRKMRNLKRTYMIIKDKNKKSSTGHKRISWEFFDMFEEMFADEETMNIAASRKRQDDSLFHCNDDSQASTSAASISTTSSGAERKSPLENKVQPFKWDNLKTKYFLNAYFEMKDKFRNPKMKKKTLWREILKKMQRAGIEVQTEDDLDRKMRNLKRTYRTIKDNIENSPAGRVRVSWEFFDLFEELFGSDVTMNNMQENMLSQCNDDSEASISEASSSPRSVGAEKKNQSNFEEIFIQDAIMNKPAVLSSMQSQEDLLSACKDVRKKKPSTLYYFRKKQLVLEKKKVVAMQQLTVEMGKIREAMEEKNKILKEFLQNAHKK